MPRTIFPSSSCGMIEYRVDKLGILNSLAYLASTNVVIWVGLFFYLRRLDRRISERERGR